MLPAPGAACPGAGSCETPRSVVRSGSDRSILALPQEGTMSEQDNVAAVKRGYGAFGRGETGDLRTLLDPDTKWVTVGPPILPTAGIRRGHEEMPTFFTALQDLVETHRMEPRTFLADGDYVVVLGAG